MQHSPRQYPVAPPATYSTLPELAQCELPEVVFHPDGNLPEVVKYDEFPSNRQVPDSIPSVKDGGTWHSRRPWMHFPRKRRHWIVIIVVLLVFSGILIGVVVSTSQASQRQPQTEADKASSSTVIPLPSSTTPSFAFGTPTTFPSPSVEKPLASVCRGTVCPKMFTSARLTDSLSDPSTTYLFARGQDNTIWHRAINESGLTWESEWESLGGNFLSQPAAMSCEEGRVDVFAVWAEDRSMRFKTFQNGIWSTEWASLGGNSVAPPVVCGFHEGNINVVTINQDDHNVHQKHSRDGYTFGPISQESDEWNILAAPFSSGSSPDFGCSPTSDHKVLRHNAVAYGKGDSDTGSGIYFLKYNKTANWDKDWTRGQGEYSGDPVLVSTIDRSDFFGVGVDMAIWYTNWTNAGGYSSAVSLGGEFQSVVSAFITAPSSRVHVLAVGTDDRLKHKTCIGGTWATEWEDLGGHFNSSPKAVQLSGRTVAVFGIGPDGGVIHSTFEVGAGYTWGSGQWYADGGQISTDWYRDELAS